jgi:nicotinamidase-related amidase
MDLQRDFLEDGGRMPVARAQVEPLLESVAGLRDEALAAGRPVLRVENLYSPSDVGNLFRKQAAVRGNAGAEWDPRVASDGEGPFTKDAPDAFTNADFDLTLRQRQVNHLVLAGVFADGCVKWTARGARNRGYRVTLVEPAVAAATDSARRVALGELRAEGVDVVSSPAEVVW